MIAFLLRVVALALAAHAEYPAAELGDVAIAAWRAVDVETSGAPAELLIAIAQHESDLDPCAVSFLAGGARHDVRDGCTTAIPEQVVCGYLSAMGDRATCVREMRRDGAMTYGAAELEEWAGNCGRWGMRGDVACVLRGHAGGTACAMDVGACTRNDRAFADLFAGHAANLSRRTRATSTSNTNGNITW